MNIGSKKMYKKKKSKAMKAVVIAKGRAYEDLYARLEKKKVRTSCTDWLGRDRAGKDVQHVRVMKDENGNVMVSSEAVLKRWKEYFEKLMNKENYRDPRTEEVEVVNEKVNCVSREEGKNTLRRIKNGSVLAKQVANRSLEVHGRDGDSVFDQTAQQTISL